MTETFHAPTLKFLTYVGIYVRTTAPKMEAVKNSFERLIPNLPY